MAENDQEMNPRKKLKTEHNPDQNGDIKQSGAFGKGGSSQDRGDSSAEITDKSEAYKDDSVKDIQGDGHDDVEREKLEINSKEADGEKNIDHQEEKVIDLKDENGDSNRDVDISDGESDVSGLSDMSGLSGEDSWKAAPAGPMAWVYRCMEDGVDPKSILSQILSDEHEIPDVDDFTLWKLVVNLVSEPPPRNKLPDVNTLEDVIQLLQKCEKIIVLTGAGVSVSCGIPDFRSRNGIYARLAVDFPDLPDPQAMFDIRYFRKDQRPFFKFAKEIYPGQFEPSRCHKFIQLIEEHGKLLRNYTQNIDTLEQVAGIKNVIQCHGSFATATCMQCNHKCSSEDIKEEIVNQVMPMCPKCDPRTPLSVMKPDIVFFGESLPEEFHHQMSVDKDSCDLLIVIGSSLKVRPVALIPNSLPAHVPQILINKEHLRNLNFDVELLGDCDIVVGEICRRLGKEWSKIANEESLSQISMDELLTPVSSPKPAETNLETSETKTLDSENTLGEERGRGQNSGNESSSKTEAEGNAEVTVAKLDDKCLCNDSVSETKEMINVESEKSGNADSSKTELSSLAEKIQTETRATAGELANDETANSNANKNGQGDSASSKTDRLDTTADIDKSNIDAKPGGSSADREMVNSDADVSGMRGLWKSYRQNVACRLGRNKFCFVPPHKYIFPEAEYFTWLKSDSESDADTDSSLDSSRELKETQATTESNALDVLTADDKEDKQNLKEVTNVAAEADSVNISDINAHSKDPVTCLEV